MSGRLIGLLIALAGVLSADSRCLTCHPKEVRSYAATGMGRSMAKPSAEAVLDQQFRHPLSGTELNVSWRSGKLLHQIRRKGQEAVYPAAWAVGSGNHGKSYLITIGDALFQSPISWYTARRTWDLSPGFESAERLDFFRPVTADCLFCHAGNARSRRGTLNRYLDPPFEPASIGCDRCHGDVSAHLARPAKNNIVNPARLVPEHRDAVCEQCHLSGEARIPNPGKTFSDYRAGMRLEEVFSVYVKQAAGDPKGLKVVSHSEQMARSRCFLESRQKLWCGTCHNPHQSSEDKVSWYEQKCSQCHENEKTAAHRKEAGRDCAGCHMPKLKSYDGGHTAFTDHWIRVGPEQRATEATDGLRAWREPPQSLRSRNLGLAYISVGQLPKGLSLLGSTTADGVVETARGFVLVRTDKAREAVEAFRRASNEAPADSTRRLNLAAALAAAGELVEAKRHAEEAIALEPLLEDAYALLAEIEPGRSEYWKSRYRKLAPQRLLP